MRIDVPEYNTFVEFPDTMDMEAIKTKVREKFPPLVSTLTTQPPESVEAQAAKEIVSPLGKEYISPKSFTEKAKDALSTLSGAIGVEGYIGSPDTEGIDRVVEAGKQTTEALTHTARGFAAWPIAKITGLYINATFGAEMAKKAEEGIMHAVTGEPSGEEARNLFDTIATVAGIPFVPAQFIGEQISKIQPELGYAIGTGLEFATPMIGHYGIKRLAQFGKIYKAVKEGKELPTAERSILDNMPENERMATMVAIELAKEEHPKTLIEEFKKNGIPEKDAMEFVNTIAEEPIEPKPAESTVTPKQPRETTTQELIERINKQPPSAYEKTISDISKEVSKEIEVPPIGRARGLTVESVNELPINTKKSTYSFDDPNIEASYKAAHGVPRVPVLDTVKEILTSFWEDFTRTYKHLPNEPEFYPAQVILKRQEKAFNKASYETLNALRGETHKFDTYQMDVYSRKVLLDDLMETSAKGKEIPFGFTKETLKNELSKIDAEVGKDPVIQKSYERRKQVQKALVDEYVELRKHFGDDVSKKFKNENYYRHQVIEYAKVKGLSGTGEGMKVPTWRGFLKERKGSELSINTNYLQAEYEWRAQMLYDVQTLKTLKELDAQYNLIASLKEAAKEKGVEWQSLIPDGYTEWQPRKGNIFYTTDSIPSKLAEELRDGILGEIGITADDLRQSLSIGGKRRELVIPEEIAKTLDEFGQSKPENVISRASKNLLTSWKVWTLISPTRFFKYNIRNMTGDADAGFVGNKSGFMKTPEAAKDLYGTMFFDKPMEGKLKDFFDRSGFDTTLQAQEMGDINALRAFKNIADEHGGFEKIPGKVWNGYWKAARVTTDFRELVLRYANYIDYLEQIEKGGGKPKNYGASDPKKIDSLKDYKDKAYELSNDLLGAYDRISVAGQYIRGHVFPFWSWKEVNFKRYIQLFKNAANEGTLSTAIGNKILGTVANPYTAFRVGSFMVKATSLWSIMQVWNNLMFPEEEKELSPDTRGRPHIIFGRDENGKILHFSRIGALGDFLEWFGLDAAPQTIDNWLSGKKTLLETAEDMAKNPVNTIVQGINPFVKVPFELATRQSLFPDVFKMGMIRDRGLYLARSVGLENEYKAVAGIPFEGRLATLPQIFYYKADPGQGAYSEIQSLKREFMEKIGKGYDGWMLTPKGQALYNIKLAIRYSDEEALLKSLEEYVRLGGTNQGFKASIKAMEPLHGLKPKEKKAFIESLDVEDLERLEKAITFYEKTLKGGLQ